MEKGNYRFWNNDNNVADVMLASYRRSGFDADIDGDELCAKFDYEDELELLETLTEHSHMDTGDYSEEVVFESLSHGIVGLMEVSYKVEDGSFTHEFGIEHRTEYIISEYKVKEVYNL